MNTPEKILALFPGQGSQSVGMGLNLTESSEIAREMFNTADKALGFSLSEICFTGPAEKLTETAITQPAILTVSSICFEIFRHNHAEARIVAGAGHSLGEYSALVAANAISFEDAVQLVHKRGRYMQEAVPAGEGKMVAVLGQDLEKIEAVLTSCSELAELANLNAPGQIVVAGSAAGIDEFISQLGGAKYRELPVSAPFHCSLMKPAEENLARDLNALTINPATFPIYANFTAESVSQPERIKELLTRQVCGSVRWIECMNNAIANSSPTIGFEFGAGRVLSGLMKRINKGFPVQTKGALSELVAD